MTDDGPLLSDDEILERLPLYRCIDASGAEHRARDAEGLVKYRRGPVAEDAVRILVEGFPSELLDALVTKHVLRWAVPPDHGGYCRTPHVIAERLVEYGFGPVQSTRGAYEVGWSQGELLRGENICRIALLAVWLRQMRETEPNATSPAY